MLCVVLCCVVLCMYALYIMCCVDHPPSSPQVSSTTEKEIAAAAVLKEHGPPQRVFANGGWPGMLTTTGLRQGYALGRELRERYIHGAGLLSDKWDPEHVYMRSSLYGRTVATLKVRRHSRRCE